jgi:hypothetical protein
VAFPYPSPSTTTGPRPSYSIIVDVTGTTGFFDPERVHDFIQIRTGISHSLSSLTNRICAASPVAIWASTRHYSANPRTAQELVRGYLDIPPVETNHAPRAGGGAFRREATCCSRALTSFWQSCTYVGRCDSWITSMANSPSTPLDVPNSSGGLLTLNSM